MPKKFSSPKKALAGYTNNRIWINEKVPKKLRPRLKAHEEHELELRKKGVSYKKAHKSALKVEHKGMTKKQVSRYEGTLGAIAKKIKREK